MSKYTRPSGVSFPFGKLSTPDIKVTTLQEKMIPHLEAAPIISVFQSTVIPPFSGGSLRCSISDSKQAAFPVRISRSGHNIAYRLFFARVFHFI